MNNKTKMLHDILVIVLLSMLIAFDAWWIYIVLTEPVYWYDIFPFGAMFITGLTGLTAFARMEFREKNKEYNERR